MHCVWGHDYTAVGQSRSRCNNEQMPPHTSTIMPGRVQEPCLTLRPALRVPIDLEHAYEREVKGILPTCTVWKWHASNLALGGAHMASCRHIALFTNQLPNNHAEKKHVKMTAQYRAPGISSRIPGLEQQTRWSSKTH